MISEAIIYCAEDQACVADYEALAPEAQLADYWSDASLDGLRWRVKAFYIKAQRTRCCYCNRHLASDNHRVWDVEHVASRARYPRFMFEPMNLAASCPDCNIAKGEAEVLVNKERKSYPKDSAGFLIVHPHFDKYEDHIFQQGLIYQGKTRKGTKTIYTCDLLRFSEKFIAWENSAADTRFEDEVDTLFDDNNKMAQAAMEAIVARLPDKR